MVEFKLASPRGLRRTMLTALSASACMAALGSTPADARYHRHYGYAHAHYGYAHAQRARVASTFRGYRHFRPVHIRAAGGPGGFTPAFAAYAIDGNSGRVLYARDENAPRHPASVTKVMTLYLLFEQLDRGAITLDTRIEVSHHAASQSPTKLGLRPGSTIRVEDAIKSIVTKSANDMAVAIAERLGGSEENFARLMTRKAHALGMSRSTFVNASGLPDDRQITTARDLATLGRAIHDRYPSYFRFFSTPSFRYAGQYMANHNHLMEQVEGMDGIKTGYTRSSGFNLLSSVNRNGHWLVSVVLGGKTRLGRDRIMADLIESQIDKCATSRTAPMVAENPALERVAEAIPVVQHEGDVAPPVENVDEEAAETRPAPREAVPVAATQPLEEPSEAPKPPPVAPASKLQTRIAKLDTPAPMPRARPAFVSGMPRGADSDMTTTGSISRRSKNFDGTTSRYDGAATATPSTLKRRPQRERAEAIKEKLKPVRVASMANDAPAPMMRSASAHGTMIQIGATPTIEAANELIARARAESHGALGRARPFTEKVVKGGATLYRARFADLRPDTADSACRALKRAGIACFTSRN